MQTFEDVRSRTFARLEGITDAEYLWQPVPGCMTVRPAPDGEFRADPRPPRSADPAPVTTIAWRTWHIGADCFRGFLRFFEDVDLANRHAWPGTADEGVRALKDDWEKFEDRVAALGDACLLEPMGPRAGDFAHESFLLLALHALDEAAHHAAEIGLLRDLYLRDLRDVSRAD